MDNLTIIVYDVECYPNYFMLGYSVATPILDKDGSISKFIYQRDYADTRDMVKLRKVLNRIWDIKDNLVMVGYNNSGYDKVILEEAYYNRSKEDYDLAEYLSDISQDLIKNHTSTFKYNHIPQFDLMPKNSISLKAVGVLLHKDNIQELPYEPDMYLSNKQIDDIIKYNQENDMTITEELLNLKIDDFITQYDVIKEFNLPISCFSMSKGGLSEAVLGDKTRVVPKILRTSYKCPIKLDFQSQILKDIKYEMENTIFTMDGESYSKTFMWGDMEVSIGEGGIHGVIKNYYCENIIDVDGTSYYPSMIINLDTLPTSKEHKEQYKTMRAERVIYKKQGKKGKANARKLILNNVFGKTKFATKDDKGNIKKLGIMFDFKAFMTTTLTGQLMLLKLMEDLTLAGYKVIYLNTDGLSFEDNGNTDWKEICANWEKMTQIDLEYTNINRWWMKDVNNYVLEAQDGDKIKYKIKGFYNTEPLCPTGFVTNSAQRRICINAVVDYLLKGTPIADTINNSNDIRDFILHYKFSNKFDNVYLNEEELNGRVFRWYKSTKNKNELYTKNKNTGNPLHPANSENISLVYKLSDFETLPSDLDRNWYIQEAYKIYKDLTGKDIKGNPKKDLWLKELKERGII